jgi:hypothetical protein
VSLIWWRISKGVLSVAVITGKTAFLSPVVRVPPPEYQGRCIPSLSDQLSLLFMFQLGMVALDAHAAREQQRVSAGVDTQPLGRDEHDSYQITF